MLVLAVSATSNGLSGPGSGYPGSQDGEGRGAGPHIFHEPVLLSEAVHHLVVRPDGVYVDATLGEGGHASAILRATSPNGRLLGIDRDPRTLSIADQRLRESGPRFTPARASYADLLEVSRSRGIEAADGVLMLSLIHI